MLGRKINMNKFNIKEGTHHQCNREKGASGQKEKRCLQFLNQTQWNVSDGVFTDLQDLVIMCPNLIFVIKVILLLKFKDENMV